MTLAWIRVYLGKCRECHWLLPNELMLFVRLPYKIPPLQKRNKGQGKVKEIIFNSTIAENLLKTMTIGYRRAPLYIYPLFFPDLQMFPYPCFSGGAQISPVRVFRHWRCYCCRSCCCLCFCCRCCYCCCCWRRHFPFF